MGFKETKALSSCPTPIEKRQYGEGCVAVIRRLSGLAPVGAGIGLSCPGHTENVLFLDLKINKIK